MNEQLIKSEWVRKIIETVGGDDNDLDARYRIGDLAAEFDVTLRTLRFYEDRGLLSPERSGSQRLYSAADRARLKIILLAKQVGFSLVEIEKIMTMYDTCDQTGSHAPELLKMFREQRAVLASQQSNIAESIDNLENTIRALEAST